MSTTAEQIKKIRDITGAGILDTKRTLEQFNGDYDKALAVLKEKARQVAEKKAERATKQGLIETYLHTGGRVGVMIEVNCETDFVAATPDFRELAHDLALQVAATKPLYVSQENVPASVVEELKKTMTDAAIAEGKPANVVERIVQGKLESYYKDNCLMSQKFIRDETMTITDRVKGVIGKLGENITIRRFARFELGE